MKASVLPPMPLLRQGSGLRSMHLQSLLALSPLVLVSWIAWGLPALRLQALSVLAFIGVEALVKAALGNRQRFGDGHSLLNGLLLALLCPVGVDPLAFFGCALLAALVGEQFFGGMGRTPFHPAIVGRLLLFLLAPSSRGSEAGLQALWWLPQGWLSWPIADAPRAVSVWDEAWRALRELERIAIDQAGQIQGLDRIAGLQETLRLPGWREFLWAPDAAALGQLSLLLVVPGAVLLFARRVLDWKAPFIALLVCGGVLSLLDAASLVESPPFLRALVSTPLCLLLVFYSSNPVFTPMTPRGRALYGLLLGLCMSAPLLLGLPDPGLLLALPLAGALVPWIDYWTLPRGPR